MRQRRAHGRRPGGAEQPGQRADPHHFHQSHTPQQLRRSAQGAPHRHFARAVLPRQRQRGGEHRQPGREGEQKQKLHGRDDLLDQLAQMREQAADIDHGEIGKLPHQGVVHALRISGGAIGGQIGHGLIFQQGLRQQHKEVGMHGAPVDMPHAGDGRGHALACNIESQGVAEFEAQGFGDALLHRQAFGIGPAGIVPVACDQGIGLGQGGAG